MPLSLEAVAELAAPHGVDAAELHRRTAGNPFFVTEALAAGGVELPATVRDAVLARVAPLSPPARRLLDAAAIVPGTVELPLLEALAGDAIEPPRGVPVVRRARRRRAPASRSGTSSRASPSRRRSRPTSGCALHRRALAALAGHADPARLAYHAEGAGDGDAVLRFAPAAAERAAAAGAHREAAAQYARALRFARRPASPRRAPRCSSAARTSASSPTSRARRSAICSARSSATASSATAAARATCCARCRASSGAPASSTRPSAPGREAVAVLEPLGPGRELAMAYANMASLAMNHEDAGETRRLGRAGARARPRASATTAIEIHALNSIGTMEFLAGGPGRARHGRAQPRARAASRSSSTTRCARTRTSRGRPSATAPTRSPTATCDAATEYASDPELDLWWLYLLGYRARVELDQGRWDDAAETAALVIRERRGSPLPVDPRAHA